MNVGTIEAFLKLRDELSPALKIATQNLDQFGSRAKAIGSDLLPMSLALGGVGVIAAKSAIDLNKTMANIATLIPGNSKRILELKTAVQDLSIVTGKTTQDMATGMYEVISTWEDGAETVKLLEINAKAAAAGLSTTQQAIALTSSVTAGYGDMSATAVQKVADLAFQTVNLGQTTFPQLASSMGAVVPFAAALKVSQEELFATYATLSGKTGDTAEVSTQLKAVMSDLASPTDAMKEAMAKLNITNIEATVKTDGLVNTLRRLVGTTDGSISSMTKLHDSVRALPAVLALTQGQAAAFDDKYKKILATFKGANDTAFKEQTQGINSVGFAWDQLKQRVMVMTEHLGDKLLPALGKVIAMLNPMVDVGFKAVDMFGKLPIPIQLGAIALATFFALLGPGLIALGMVANGVSSLLVLWGTFTAATTLLGNTIPILTARLYLMELGFSGILVVFLKLAAAFAAGWALGTLIKELIDWVGRLMGLKDATDAAADAVYQFFNGSNEVAARGTEATAGWTEAQKKAYNAHVERTKALQALAAEQRKAIAAQTSSTAAIKTTIEAELKAASNKEKLAKASELLGRTVVDLATAEKVLAVAMANGAAEKATKEYQDLVKAYRDAHTEAGITAKQAKDASVVVSALGTVGKASAKEVGEAIKALSALGDVGRAKAQLLKADWEAANGVFLLTSKNVAAGFTGTMNVTNQVADRKAEATVVKELEDAHKKLQDTKANEILQGTVLKQMLLDEKISLADYVALGGKVSEVTEDNTKATFDWRGALDELRNAFDILGVSADSALMKGVVGLMAGMSAAKQATEVMKKHGQVTDEVTGKTRKATFLDLDKVEKGKVAMAGLNAAMVAYKSGALGGAAAGAAFGASFGPWGAAIGGVVGGLLGIFGGAKKAREEAKKLAEELKRTRDEFVKNEGGLATLQSKAREAGINLDKMFSAKSAEALKVAIDEVKGQLDTWGEANDKLQAAIDKYGISIEQLGPKFRQQQLDKMAGDLLQDYQLLIAAGVEQNVVIEKMAPGLNEYVQTALKAGVAIPMSMKPAIDKMIEMGMLTDENGVAFGSAEEAGLTFTETLTEGLGRAIEAINKLVDALLGVPGLHIPVTVGSGGVLPGGNEDYTPHPSVHAASGLYSPALPRDLLIQAHRGERVEITPAAQTAANDNRGITLTVGTVNVMGGTPMAAGQAFVDALKTAVRANAGGIVSEITLKQQGA